MAKLENDTKYVDLTLKKVTKYLIDWECKKPLKDGKGEVKKKKKKKPAGSMSKPASQNVQHALCYTFEFRPRDRFKHNTLLYGFVLFL